MTTALLPYIATSVFLKIWLEKDKQRLLHPLLYRLDHEGYRTMRGVKFATNKDIVINYRSRSEVY